jgi:hypothetical protein
LTFGGSVFPKVYSEFASIADFSLHPAVRKMSGNRGTCIEEMGCNYEKVTLCTFNASNSTATNVKFLACMDETKVKRDALHAGEPCAQQASVDWTAVTTCYDGDLGNTLLKQANKEWISSTLAFVPQVLVNGKPMTKEGAPTYAEIKAAICAASPSTTACN